LRRFWVLRRCRILTLVHPVLFHIGNLVIPSYGAVSSLGVLLGLFLAQRTARTAGVNPAQIWNLSVIALFAALVGERVLLIALNWSDLRQHPGWVLALAMVHHPLLAGAGAVAGSGTALAYVRWQKMSLAATTDVLAAPLALGLACEQVGALLAGSGYGTETAVRWSVVYTHPLAARWSGTPLGVPLQPVQAYAAAALLTLSLLLVVFLPVRKQAGDWTGLWLLGVGITIYLTELWRDREGRGNVLHGALDVPQLLAVFFVLAGGFVLKERKMSCAVEGSAGRLQPTQSDVRRTERQSPENEAAHE
jgi:phosphatidylglycerol:prolipoprotein diacylglycerol transferase